MTSLRNAILIRMAALLLAVGIVSSGATYIYVREEAQATFDAEIRQFATYIDALDHSAMTSKAPTAPVGAEDLFLVQVWDPGGKLTWSSLPSDEAAAPASAGYATNNIGSAHWRSYTVMSATRILRVSLPLDERNEQASTAALQIAIPMAVVIPLSWLVLSVMIDRIMRGLDRSARLLSSRRSDESQRIAEQGLPSEVMPFVTSINELVQRLNDNVEQQKRFVSDAAHELRTPLAAIGIQVSNLETVLTTKVQRERLSPLKEGVKRTNKLVERLLHLARAERTVDDGLYHLGSIESLFSSLQSTFEPISKSRRIELAFLAERPFDVSNILDLTHVLTVLIENAIAYSEDGSKVSINAKQDYIVILDEGQGVPSEKLSYIFERFYRADTSRVPGTGLGLSIAKAICDRNGWILELQNRADRSGIIATLQLK